MPSVLFVCSANRFRSPLAAAFFEKALVVNEMPGSWGVGSAGTWAIPRQPVLSFVSEVARTYNLDLSKHRSSRVNRKLLSKYDLVLVMQTSQKEALQNEFPSFSEHIYTLSEVVEQRSYDIPDSTWSFQGVADVGADLDDLIRRGLQGICVLATYLHNLRQKLRS